MTPNRLDALSRSLLLAYALATLGVGLLLSSQLFAGDELALPLKLLSFTLLLFTLWRWPGALLLAGIQAYLFFREPRSLTASDPVGVVVLALLGLLLVMVVSRLRTLLQMHSVHGIRDWIALFREQTEEGPLEAERRSHHGSAQAVSDVPLAMPWLRSLAWVAVTAVLCVAIAAAVLWFVPLDSSSQRNLRLTPAGLRTIQIGFLLATTSIVVIVFVGELLWRRLSPAQARTYLLSSMTSWIGHDLRWIVRRRQSMRRRDARRHARKSNISKES